MSIPPRHCNNTAGMAIFRYKMFTKCNCLIPFSFSYSQINSFSIFCLKMSSFNRSGYFLEYSSFNHNKIFFLIEFQIFPTLGGVNFTSNSRLYHYALFYGISAIFFERLLQPGGKITQDALITLYLTGKSTQNEAFCYANIQQLSHFLYYLVPLVRF